MQGDPKSYDKQDSSSYALIHVFGMPTATEKRIILLRMLRDEFKLH
jgi:hypothetical protein